MNMPPLTPKSAWLPITPRGVAAFGNASTRRLLFIQFLIAVIAAGAFGWFLRTAWIPTVRAAIAQMPAGARISAGTLEWPSNAPVVLAEGHFLAVVVDPAHSGQLTTTADVKLELGKRDWQVSSLLGVLDAPSFVNTTYPTQYSIALQRSELEPWWGAREPFILLIVGGGMVVYLMLSWAALATIYFPVAWLVAFFANRALTWGGSWRLAGATLMPGALLLSLAIVLHGLRVLDLLKLGVAFGLHFLVTWIYLVVSPLFLARHPEAPNATKNPFSTAV